MPPTFDSIGETMQARYSQVVAELQCPHHQHSAEVRVIGDSVPMLEVDIFCCCELMAERVYHALQEAEHQYQLTPLPHPSIGLAELAVNFRSPAYAQAA